LDEKCKKREETIQRVATNTIGYTRKQAYKEWCDEENFAARERAIQIKTRGAKSAYKLARTKERRLFRKKARQLDEAPTNDVSLEIQRGIQTANRCFFGLRKHLQSSHFSRQTKFTIRKTLIRPVLLYSSVTWVLTKREENQLLVFERKVLRTIWGPKIKNGVYRRRYNHELEKRV
jgi:hypothetical protein